MVSFHGRCTNGSGVRPIHHAAGGPGPERLHTCQVYGAVYTSGVRLGAHMRNHYMGKPIVPRKKAPLLFPIPPDLSLTIAVTVPPPAVEPPVVAPATGVAPQPPKAPTVPMSCLKIFGVTIVHHAKKEEEQPQAPVDDKH